MEMPLKISFFLDVFLKEKKWQTTVVLLQFLLKDTHKKKTKPKDRTAVIWELGRTLETLATQTPQTWLSCLESKRISAKDGGKLQRSTLWSSPKWTMNKCQKLFMGMTLKMTDCLGGMHVFYEWRVCVSVCQSPFQIPGVLWYHYHSEQFKSIEIY